MFVGRGGNSRSARWSRSLTHLRAGGGLVIVALLVTATGAAVLRPGRHDRQSKPASFSVSPAVLTYFSQIREGLSPLLVNVRALPSVISVLQKDRSGASPGQLQAVAAMAEDFATARDLVGRVPVPRQAPTAVGELMQISCQLYREAALSVAELATVRPGASAQAVLHRAAVLNALGDRVIDQVRRLLQVDRAGAEQANIEYRYLPPVPDVATVFAVFGPLASHAVAVSDDLRQAANLLDVTSPSVGVVQDLVAVATRLEQQVRPPEGVISARFAILVALLAADAAQHGQMAAAGSLSMISHDLWLQAPSLSPHLRNAFGVLAPSATTRMHVWTGGAFNGKPPLLLPGQDIGSGLPGGLPPVDTSKILGG